MSANWRAFEFFREPPIFVRLACRKPGHDKARRGLGPLRDDFPDTHNCKKTDGLSVVMQPDQVVQKTLVERLARRELQPLDLVLDHQFAALQLDDL